MNVDTKAKVACTKCTDFVCCYSEEREKVHLPVQIPSCSGQRV